MTCKSVWRLVKSGNCCANDCNRFTGPLRSSPQGFLSFDSFANVFFSSKSTGITFFIRNVRKSAWIISFRFFRDSKVLWKPANIQQTVLIALLACYEPVPNTWRCSECVNPLYELAKFGWNRFFTEFTWFFINIGPTLTLWCQKKLKNNSNITKPWGLLRNVPAKRLQSFAQQFPPFPELQTTSQVTQTQDL